jgi:hypothetical protein
MRCQGEILNRSLSEVRTTPDGRALLLFLTDTVPPYDTIILICHDVLSFHMHRTAGDEAPFFLGEVAWRPLEGDGAAARLSALGYPFSDEQGKLLEPGWGQVVHLHFEGSVCGDVLCRTCSVQQEESETGLVGPPGGRRRA